MPCSVWPVYLLPYCLGQKESAVETESHSSASEGFATSYVIVIGSCTLNAVLSVGLWECKAASDRAH